jgi:hypothetical protein
MNFCGRMPPIASIFVHAFVMTPSHMGIAPPSLIAFSAANACMLSAVVMGAVGTFGICLASRERRVLNAFGVGCAFVGVGAENVLDYADECAVAFVCDGQVAKFKGCLCSYGIVVIVGAEA